MSRFPPSSPRDAFKAVPTPMSDDDHPTPLEQLPKTVFVPILLTRPLYSQLVLQRFFAPKVFEKVGWSDGEKGGEEERRRAVGMKIVSSDLALLSCISADRKWGRLVDLRCCTS